MDIEKTFSYHPPKPGQPGRYEGLRNMAKQFAQLIDSYCPESREKSLAMTHLQTTIMWANAAIAINEEAT